MTWTTPLIVGTKCPAGGLYVGKKAQKLKIRISSYRDTIKSEWKPLDYCSVFYFLLDADFYCILGCVLAPSNVSMNVHSPDNRPV